MYALGAAEAKEADDIVHEAYPVTGRYWWAALHRAGLRGEAHKLEARYATGGAHLVRDLD